MVRLTAADEYFYHQIPEPLPNVVTFHEHWRESLFFVMHPQDEEGDVLILTLAHFPKREEMDSLQMCRFGGQLAFARHARHYEGDPHTMVAGPVRVGITEPYKTVKLFVDPAESPIGLDVTFTARTRECGLRRGTMKRGSETIWDQSHMIQSGRFNGTYTFGGKTYEMRDWWGQRDHSWGIRDHLRCPMWQWLAIQLPDGMLGIWNWEYENGQRVYTDGYWAPADMSEPVQVVDYQYDLHWTDASGARTSYGRDGETVAGLEGAITVRLADGHEFQVEGAGRWHARYGQLGGGQVNMQLRTSDGRVGNAAYEITGSSHHHFFPVARAENYPPGP